MARTEEDCFENLDKLGRQYRIPVHSKSAIPYESARHNTAKIKRSATCCSKCGKRKRPITEPEDCRKPLSNCAEHIHSDNDQNSRSCHQEKDVCDHFKKYREVNMQASSRPPQEDTCVKANKHPKHCHHRRHSNNKVQCELAIDALNKKVSLVLEPCPRTQRRRSLHSRASSCRKHASRKHVTSSPCPKPKRRDACKVSCKPGNTDERSPSETSSCSKDRYPSRKHHNSVTENHGKTDYAEMGRKIWQDMFEATEQACVPKKNACQDKCPPSPPRRAQTPCRPPPAAPRKVTWCPPPKPSCRRSPPPVMEHRIPDPCQASGKYIKLKVGKHFHMVELPEKADEPEDDQVQILLRQGKCVTWRKYKVFDRS